MSTIPKSPTRKLQKLILAEQHAHNAVNAEMHRLWPVGRMVHVLLRRTQKRHTVATVQGHYDGRVVVRLQTINRRGNNTVKRVPWHFVSL